SVALAGQALLQKRDPAVLDVNTITGTEAVTQYQ
ncbi:MAG: hypothetical protein HW386_1161, partial [Gammaproteobacteria bacterium]|nr:hypothetical protein [Gammaproteobacteria bacterium]